MDRDSIVLEVLSHATRMISNYACAYGLEFEDIRQELACRMLEAWPKVVCKEHVRPYLYGIARNQLLKMVPRDEKPVRLEEIEETLTLDMVCNADQVSQVIQAVHNALRKCTARTQAYAVKAYKLVDYKPDIPLPEAKPTSFRNRSIREVFSRDEQILHLIGC